MGTLVTPCLVVRQQQPENIWCSNHSILGYSTKICQWIPVLVKIGQWLSDTLHKALQDFWTQRRKIAKNSSEGKLFPTKLARKNVTRYTSKQILSHSSFLSNRPEFQRILPNGCNCITIKLFPLLTHHCSYYNYPGHATGCSLTQHKPK